MPHIRVTVEAHRGHDRMERIENPIRILPLEICSCFPWSSAPVVAFARSSCTVRFVFVMRDVYVDQIWAYQ